MTLPDRYPGVPQPYVPDIWRPDPNINYTELGRKLFQEYAKGKVPTGRPVIPIFRGYESMNFPHWDYTPPQRGAETAQMMPHWNDLTPTEQWLYDKLPGWVGPETVPGRILNWIGNSPLGKALSFLDIGAEFTERLGGLASQFWNAKDDPVKLGDLKRDLTAAWYAGSLAADMTNLPTFRWDENGQLQGLQIPHDLPGATGIAAARIAIEQLVRNGATYSEALQQVKSNYYNSLGALQLRAQMYDMYSHVLLDPLNYVLPYVKPIERIRVASELAGATKWADEVLDASQTALKASESMDEIAAIANKTNLLKGTTLEAFNTAQAAGDIEKARSITTELLDGLGLTTKDRLVLSITGRQDPLKPQNWIQRKLFGLTSESRAHELVTTVHDNVGSYIVARADDTSEGVHRIADDIARAASGSVGPELGHAFVTQEGRAVQGLLNGFDIEAQQLVSQFDLLTAERLDLATIARQLNMDEVKLMGRLANGEYASISRQLDGLFAPEHLEALYNKLQGMPYSPKVFKLQLMNKLAEHTAKQSVLTFGIESRGFLEKLSAAVKSAETLAFLRINPGYMIRNVLNNEFTMIGRGLGVNMEDIGKIVDEVIGFEPMRMSQGFGQIGDAIGVASDEASQIIADAARGERGFLDRVADRLNGIKPFGKLDMGYISSKAERNASQRAFTTGYLQGWKRYFWKPGVGFDSTATYFPRAIADQINTIDPNILPALDRGIASATNPANLDSLARGNLNISINNIFDDASKRLGYDVGDALPQEFVAKIQNGLQEAAEKGSVREFMAGVRRELQDYLDEANKSTVQFFKDRTITRIQLEGPGAVPKIWSEQMDAWYDASIYHAEQMERIAEAIRAQTDPDIIHRMWQMSAEQEAAFYNRQWDRFDGVVEGIVKGAKAQTDEMPGFAKFGDDIVSNFKEIKRGWRKWWQNKRKMSDDFWNAIAEGKKPARTWEDIQAEATRTYQEMVATEQRLTGTVNDLVTNALPEEFQQTFRAWRQLADNLMREDAEAVVAHFENVKGMSAERRAEAWTEFWQGRIQRANQRKQVEFLGESAFHGDQQAMDGLRQVPVEPKIFKFSELSGKDLRDIGIDIEISPQTQAANPWSGLLKDNEGQYRYIIEGKTKADVLNQVDEMFNDVGFLDNLPDHFSESIAKIRERMIPEEIITEPVEAISKTYLPPGSADKLAGGNKLQVGAAADEFWFTRGMPSLEEIERSAIEQAAKPPLKWGDLPDELQEYLENYLQHVTGQMSDARYASVRFAEYKRDAALLNYNRRYNFDTYATMVFPYQFWFTHSAAQWLIHSVDRPAMLSTFWKLKEFMETAGSPNQALPSRLKGQFRIELPFLPDWMGDSIFIDPFRAALPFDTFAFPFEMLMQNNSNMQGRTEFILNDMFDHGEISQSQLDQALADPNDPLWQKAQEMAIQDDPNMRFNAWDFASTLLAPHAPLVWAYQTAMGTPEKIQPFTPASRTIRGVAGLLGVDWDRSPINIEARVRRELGLPEFDQWTDYRVDRMLSNMAAMGEISVDEALRAMIDRTGDAYEEARAKEQKEFGVGALGSTLGIPVKAYPEGEFLQRSLKDDYERAWQKYEAGNLDAINEFNEKHPEYEARLALWDTPEERLKKFLIDDIRDIYYSMPSLHKTTIREQLGDDFVEKFLDKETRNFDAITIDEMQVWLKLMGGDPPGTMKSEPRPIDLADPEVAWRAQAFYNMRTTYFPDWFEIQKGYYDISEEDKAGRKEYIKNNPSLTDYWDWRHDFLHRNPDVVPYLTDEKYEFKYSSPEAKARAEQPMPWFTWQEWQQYLGISTSNLVEDFILRGDPIPPASQDKVEELATNLGITYEDALALMEESLVR